MKKMSKQDGKKREKAKVAFHRRVGETIARKREEAGVTQGEVAGRLGIGEEAVSRMERGLVPPSVFRLHELAVLFKCDIDVFLRESSRRSVDQGNRMTSMLQRLASADRQFVVEVVEKLCARLDQEMPTENEVAELKQAKGSRPKGAKSAFML
ncbi:helix-turn-helix domain-containing protein [Pandoraea sp. NPDC087047]|uniref:helix-turn-helix domain-containing protein n=1 Tax=Pandoraea sp. NPDC087047 TaxID=3364390 RepID=UPI0038123EF6